MNVEPIDIDCRDPLVCLTVRMSEWRILVHDIRYTFLSSPKSKTASLALYATPRNCNNISESSFSDANSGSPAIEPACWNGYDKDMNMYIVLYGMCAMSSLPVSSLFRMHIS